MPDEIAFSYETITVPSGNVSASLTDSKFFPNSGGLQVKKALITVNPGPIISYTLNGLTVGSNTGHKMTSFQSLEIIGPNNMKNFQTTSFSSGTVASISVTYFR